jgi:hypothetical protein
VFKCLRPPPFPSNFEGFESGQILLQNMVSNKAKLPHYPLATIHSLYTLYFDTGKEGRELNQRGNSSKSWVESTNMTD